MASSRCAICDRTRGEHEADEAEKLIHHTFSSDGRVERVKDEPAKLANASGLPETTLPSDPILRYLLIQKGLVTVAELEQVEKELRATGVVRTDVNPGN